VEATRSGKAAAVNFGLTQLNRRFVVIVSGDVLPAPGAVSLIVDALRRPGVGLAGGRPLPANSDATFVGYAVHLLWRLHHRIALGQPKIGEAIAMRREAAVPLPRTSVDEPCFQALLESAGWRSAYVPEAVISNWGPRTVRDFVRQRRQVHTGNIWLMRRHAYRVPSLRPRLLITELGRDLLDDRQRLSPVRLAWTAGTVAMETWARVGARVNYWRGNEECVWAMIETAKAPPLRVEAPAPHLNGHREAARDGERLPAG
jgi:biofilm PGA synthesis N-glycosyltransferase PgaC